MNKYVNDVQGLKNRETPLIGLEIMTGSLLGQKHWTAYLKLTWWKCGH